MVAKSGDGATNTAIEAPECGPAPRVNEMDLFIFRFPRAGQAGSQAAPKR